MNIKRFVTCHISYSKLVEQKKVTVLSWHLSLKPTTSVSDLNKREKEKN